MFKPTLVLMCGLPGAGKSTLARKIERERSIVRLRTDEWMADLGIDQGEVGTAGATTEVVDFAARPPRQAGQQVKDPGDGSAAVELAEFLAGHKFI